MLIDRHFRLLGATAKPSRRFDTTDTLLIKSKRILGNKKPHMRGANMLYLNYKKNKQEKKLDHQSIKPNRTS